MKVLHVFAHPEPRSLNGALRDVAIKELGAQGHEVRVSDLYAAGNRRSIVPTFRRWRRTRGLCRSRPPKRRSEVGKSTLQGIGNAEMIHYMWIMDMIMPNNG